MTFKVDHKLKLDCWRFLATNNMGQRHSYNGNKEEQLVGLLGEIITKNMFGVQHKFTVGFDGGYDFMYKGKKYDVKTMGRNVNPKDYYVNNFVSYQKDFDCDFYIFTSLNKKLNELCICGYVSKNELMEKAMLYKKGTKRERTDGTHFYTSCDNYEIQNNQLNDIKYII